MAHVLIVDDELMIRFLVRSVLESAGHQVSEARDGQAALDLIEFYPDFYQAIILDLLMPRLSGLEFLATLANLTAYPPIIILTAHRAWIQKTLAYKVSGYLTKPFRTRDLIDTVNTQINIRAAASLFYPHTK